MRFFAHERCQPRSWSHQFMPKQVQTPGTLAPSPQTGVHADLKNQHGPQKAKSHLRELTVPCSPVRIGTTSCSNELRNTHMLLLCGMTETWHIPSTHKERHSRNRKNIYFSKVCLRPTDTCKTFSTSETKPTTAGEFTGAQQSFLTFFLAKNRRQRWAIGHSKKQMCNALLW